MKKVCLTLIILILAFAVFAQESDVVYTEGWVDIKDTSGEIYELFIGDSVRVGETVITGDDGLAELEPASGSRIIVKPGTVFSIQERIVGGERRSVVSTTLGEVAYKFNRWTGAEPQVATPSMVASIRGTELTIFAGADGTSLIVVESGAVDVESQGRTVALAPNEGVEVKPGHPPGEKFEVMRGSLDFSSWNENRVDEMMADPFLALEFIDAQLLELGSMTRDWADQFASSKAMLDQKRIEADTLSSEGKADEMRKLYEEEIKPLEVDATYMAINMRYYALSAMNFRRHVMGGFYIRMKAKFLAGMEQDHELFLSEYERLLNYYENEVVPHLVRADY